MSDLETAAVETTRRVVSTAAGNEQRSELYRDKFRVKSTRLPNWDYAGNGTYFVTICTFGKMHTLSQVVGDEVVLSAAGRIADEEWRRASHVRDYVTLDEYVIMPNHLHGILSITGRHPIHREMAAVETNRRVVSTAARTTLAAGSLGAIIGQFKSNCTKRARREGVDAVTWQARFYEHIIRDEDEMNRIRKYIIENPLKWAREEDTPANLWM